MARHDFLTSRSTTAWPFVGKLIARGFPVTGNVPVATFGEPGGGGGGGGCRRKCLGGAQIGNVNLAALNTKLNALVLQTRGGR
jgi:hypothetical protein